MAYGNGQVCHLYANVFSFPKTKIWAQRFFSLRFEFVEAEGFHQLIINYMEIIKFTASPWIESFVSRFGHCSHTAVKTWYERNPRTYVSIDSRQSIVPLKGLHEYSSLASMSVAAAVLHPFSELFTTPRCSRDRPQATECLHAPSAEWLAMRICDRWQRRTTYYSLCRVIMVSDRDRSCG